MNNANTSFNVGLGQESSTALASALAKRSRRDVCACVPYSLLGELGRDEITNCGGSPGRHFYLTTIRRNFVSSISAFIEGTIPVKECMVSSFTQGFPQRQA